MGADTNPFDLSHQPNLPHAPHPSHQPYPPYVPSQSRTSHA